MKCQPKYSNTPDSTQKKPFVYLKFAKENKSAYEEKFKEESNLNFKDLNVIKELCERNKKFEDDLEVISYLNSGSCGVVYQGEIKKSMNKKVAIKFLTCNKVTQSKRDKFIKREVQIMHKLKNKNLVNLYGIYEIGDIICMVMEFAKYGDIENFQKLIQKKTFNETLLAYITKQVLSGLLHCKQCHVAHLDIKQQNLLIDEHLNVKLTDYSVSLETNKFEKEIITLPVVGTSLFMAPEILGKKEIQVNDINKVDTYSLGVLLYHLAFNNYPYDLKISDKKNFEEIKKKITINSLFLPKLPKHSEVFRNFLRKLLDNNISERLSIEEALDHPWMKCAQLIFDEKEQIGDLEKFLINLVTDNIRSYNEMISTYNLNCLL